MAVDPGTSQRWPLHPYHCESPPTPGSQGASCFMQHHVRACHTLLIWTRRSPNLSPPRHCTLPLASGTTRLAFICLSPHIVRVASYFCWSSIWLPGSCGPSRKSLHNIQMLLYVPGSFRFHSSSFCLSLLLCSPQVLSPSCPDCLRAQILGDTPDTLNLSSGP